MNIDSTMREFVFDHGGRIARDGMIVFTEERFSTMQYTHRSINDSSVMALMLPTDTGLCLIFEHKHFEIEAHYLDYGA